jgi:hypothetical protein
MIFGLIFTIANQMERLALAALLYGVALGEFIPVIHLFGIKDTRAAAEGADMVQSEKYGAADEFGPVGYGLHGFLQGFRRLESYDLLSLFIHSIRPLPL